MLFRFTFLLILVILVICSSARNDDYNNGDSCLIDIDLEPQANVTTKAVASTPLLDPKHHLIETSPGTIISFGSSVKTVTAILFGQLLAVINAATVVCNALAPTTFPILQSAVIYPGLLILLALPQTPYLMKFFTELAKNKTQLRVYWGSAILMGISDVLANAAIVKAFQTTSALSATLVSSLSVIIVFMIQTIIFRAKFQPLNLIGSIFCFLGFVMILVSKSIGSSGEGHSYVGDLYALGAAIGYAVSNSMDEGISRMENGFPNAARFSMGAIGSLVSAILVASPIGQQDIRSLRQVLDNGPIASSYWGLAVYPALMILIYTLVPKFFQYYGAFLFNVNILTTDLYVFIFQRIYLSVSLSPIYVTGFVAIIMGLALHSMKQLEYKTVIKVINVS